MRRSTVELVRRVHAAEPGFSSYRLRVKAKMTLAGLRLGDRLDRLVAPGAGAYARYLAERPEIIGILIWPYQSAFWDVEKRTERLLNHFDRVDETDGAFAFGTDEQIVLADLTQHLPGLTLSLDQPVWFMREGSLTLNLFLGDFRAYTVAFSLYRGADGALEIVIGSVQGRNTDEALEMYRNITKALFGLRPRDFLNRMLSVVARSLGADRVLAVSQAARHHRHPYFAGVKDFPNDYDEIWAELGGARLDDEFYTLPLTPERRSLDLIKPRKRSMYRKRYEFLDDVEQIVADAMRAGRPVPKFDR